MMSLKWSVNFLNKDLLKLAYMATSGGHFSRPLGMGGTGAIQDDQYLKW